MRAFLALLAAAITTPAVASSPTSPVHSSASATKARDVQGFALGMSIKEAIKRFTVTYTQGNQVQGRVGDIELTFDVCPSGAVYFIQSTQPLGHFVVDKPFLDGLDAKLFAKYGRGGGTPDNLEWNLIEQVSSPTGQVHNFTTNWMTALVSEDSGDGVSLELKMLDFRLCWAEAEKANSKPRDRATETLKF